MVNRLHTAFTLVALAAAMGGIQSALGLTLGDTHVVAKPATSILPYGPDLEIQPYAWASGWYLALKLGLFGLGVLMLVPARTWQDLLRALRQR